MLARWTCCSGPVGQLAYYRHPAVARGYTICLSISLTVCLCVCLSVELTVRLSVCLSICLSHTDYTLNYNFESPYFGVFAANHVELLEPYWFAITSMLPQGRIDAAAWGCDGVHMPGHIAPFGLVNSGDMGQHSNAAFAALHFINHWEHTRNRSFFVQQTYPLLKEIADWWSCWLVKNITTGTFDDVQVRSCMMSHD